MNKVNKELLARALVEGVDDSYTGGLVCLSVNHIHNGFHVVETHSNETSRYWQYVCTKEEYLAAKAEKEGVKTVMDAVKYWQGSSHKNGKHEFHHTHVINAVGTDRFYSAYKSDVHHHVIICTISEYNQCVKECSTNFGKSSLKHLNIWQKGIEAEKEKPAQPVFTQAMADAGEFPQVGMKCLIQMIGAYLPVTITYNSEHVIAFAYETDNGLVETCKQKELHNVYIKPIDTRTDKEKAIEKAINNLMFYGDQSQTSQKANETLIAIIEGKIHGVKWVGK